MYTIPQARKEEMEKARRARSISGVGTGIHVENGVNSGTEGEIPPHVHPALLSDHPHIAPQYQKLDDEEEENEMDDANGSGEMR